jgi:hypothetical protein
MLQALHRKMEEEIAQLIAQVAEQAEQRSGARLLMTQGSPLLPYGIL